ncbi:MAG: radical SAM/SPASM domain-containing protein [Flavobacteriales bacterium]
MLSSKLRSVNANLYPNHVFQDPKWIVLGVNNVCNLHCKMCDVGTQNLESNFAQNLVGTHPLNMPLELIIKVIDQMANRFPKSKLAYAFTEPLVYPHLVDSVAYATKHNIYTTITTNALTLKQKAEGLANAEVKHIYVSLDGPQNIHNEIRGHKSSFQKALEGIKEIQKFKNPPTIDVICAITQWNIGHLKVFVEDLKELNIGEIAFMHTQFTDAQMAIKHNEVWGHIYPATESNLGEIDLTKMDLDLLMKEISQIRKLKLPFKVTFSPEISSMDGLHEFYLQPEKLLGKFCNAVFSSIMIKSDGSVIPAHGRCFNLTLGNLNNEDLSSIWNTKIFADFRKNLMTAGGLFPGCSRCCSAF